MGLGPIVPQNKSITERLSVNFYHNVFKKVFNLTNWNLSIRIINQNLFATTATISFTMRDSA